MIKKIIIPAFAFLSFFGCGSSSKLVLSGSGWNKIVVLDKKTKQIEWSHDLAIGSECNSVIVTPDGNIAYSYKGGAKMINLDEQVIWDYKLSTPGEIHSVSLLPEGGFLLAASGNPAQLIELDSDGGKVKVLTFDAGSDNMHGQMRQVVKSQDGNYLIPLLFCKQILEIDDKGIELRRYDVPQAPFSVLELPSKNIIVSCGDGHFFIEIDRLNGNIIRKIDQSIFSDRKIMHYVAQIMLLKNGNLVMCNWNGHFKDDKDEKVPHLIEFDKDYNIKWLFNDFTHVKKVSAGFYLENGKILNVKKKHP